MNPPAAPAGCARAAAAVAAACLLSSVSPVAAHAQASSNPMFGAAAKFNLFTTGGDAVLSGADSHGAIAANGNITLASTSSSFQVGNRLSSGSTAMVAQGNIAGASASVQFQSYGNAYATGTITNTTFTNGGSAHASQSSLPVNFASAVSYLTNLNQTLFSHSSTAVSVVKGGLSFNATGTGINYFSVSASSLASAGYIDFSGGGSNVYFVINVTASSGYSAGTELLKSGEGNFNGAGSYANVLYNLDPSIVGFSVSGIGGSILAPNADMNGTGSGYGQVNGNAVVKSFNTGANAKGLEFHTDFNGVADYYSGMSPTPAAPAALSTLVGALVGGVTLVRRRRRNCRRREA